MVEQQQKYLLLKSIYDLSDVDVVERSKFDLQFDDLPDRFRMLGLDDSLVRPSYVVNTSSLKERIKKSMDENPELNYHKDNEEYLANIMAEIAMITRRVE